MDETWKFWGIVLLIIIVATVISIILMKVAKKNKIASFIPSLLMLALSIILFVKGRFFSYCMQDLEYYLMSMIIFIAALVTLAIILLVFKLKVSKK